MIEKEAAIPTVNISGYFRRSKQGKALLGFIRDNKLKNKLISETSWFLLANLIFSASTYMVGFLVPYILNTDYMAYFSSANQIVMVVGLVFEFGISISFLRYYQIEKDSKYIYSLIQVILFAIIIVVGLFFNKYLNNAFNIDELPVSAKLFYFIVLAQYGWGYIKTWMLAMNKMKVIMWHSIIILVLRAVFLFHLFYLREFTVKQLFLDTLVYPFLPSFLHLLFVNAKTLIEALPFTKNINLRSVRSFLKKVYDYLRFSILTYIAQFIFLYTGRYLIIYLTGKNNAAVANLGYALTFIGVILVFYTTIRNYLIARLSIDKSSFIASYVNNLKGLFKYFVVVAVIASVLFSYLILMIKPKYMTLDAAIYSFILFLANFCMAYIGLFTVLSKTYDFNKLEVFLNLIRLALVILITNLVVSKNIILGLTLINAVMVLTELLFANIIIKKIKYVFV